MATPFPMRPSNLTSHLQREGSISSVADEHDGAEQSSRPRQGARCDPKKVGNFPLLRWRHHYLFCLDGYAESPTRLVAGQVEE